MGKLNEESVPLFNILNGLPSDMPIELIKHISTWDMIIKSPYGFSYYSATVGWDFKTHDSYRIADHWNFSSKGKLHCQTTEPVPHDYYTIGKFDDNIKRYIPIASYPKTQHVKDTLEYRLLHADVTYERAINHQNNELEGNPNLAEYRLKLEIAYAEKIMKLIETKLGSLK
jgi:hypothetical protein